MRRQIQQSEELIAELVAKLQAEQANLERMRARFEKREEAIAFLLAEIEEDPDFQEEVRDRLQPVCLGDVYSLHVPSGRNPTSSPTIISDENGSAKLGCAKQKLAKEWKDLLTLWGCAAEVTKAESFSDKEIKWEVAIANITRSQLEALAKAHTSPHTEVPAPGKKVESSAVDDDQTGEMIAVFDVVGNILDTYWELDTDQLDNSDFEEYPPALVSKAFHWLLDKGFVVFDQGIGWELTQKYRCVGDSTVTFDYEGAVNDFEKYKAQATEIGSVGEKISESSVPCELVFDNFDRMSPTVGEVLDGASPLDLNDEQIDELEQALASSPPPSIDDVASPAPSAYAEEMALKVKPGTKLRSFPFPRDPKHKSSRKRTGIVRQIEREGAYIYAFVAELTESGTNTRHTAYYNLEAVEILEDAPAIALEIGRSEEPAKSDFDLTLQSDGVLAGIEAEIFQFLTEKAAQADLYEGNDPNASFNEIGDGIKLYPVDRDRLRTALDNLEARGSILHRDIYGVGDRWQIAPEKPSQDHSFKVGDRVTICGDSKGEDLIGKSGTLTAVSLTGCVLFLDGEDEKNRLFFCKEDLSPCSVLQVA